MARARAHGARIAEIRLDLFSSTDGGPGAWKLERFRDWSTIGTLRSAAEGGAWRGADAERLRLFQALVPQVDAVDVELSSSGLLADVVALARDHGALAIVSHHDFESTPTPGELRRIAQDARAAGADIVKIATTPREPGDLRALAALCVESEGPLIAIGMGEGALATRLLLPALGSLVTFAALDADSATAPGQLCVEEMHAWLTRLYPAYARSSGASGGEAR